MPPVARVAQRPQRLWRFSADRLRLSSGGGIWGLLFGLAFSCAGLLCLYMFGRLLLSALGLMRPDSADFIQEPISSHLFAIAAMFILGAGHVACGTLLLWTLRTTFDRARDTVTVRSGWLGLHRRNERLSSFQRVLVYPVVERFPTRDSLFDIVLEGDPRHRLVVARVTRSHALAGEVATEIAGFTGLSDH